jgi:hypothetical protein
LKPWTRITLAILDDATQKRFRTYSVFGSVPSCRPSIHKLRPCSFTVSFVQSHRVDISTDSDREASSGPIVRDESSKLSRSPILPSLPERSDNSISEPVYQLAAAGIASWRARIKSHQHLVLEEGVGVESAFIRAKRWRRIVCRRFTIPLTPSSAAFQAIPANVRRPAGHPVSAKLHGAISLRDFPSTRASARSQTP